MKKILICAAALAAGIVFAAPASAKSWKNHGHGYSYGHSKKVMPLRSNRGGYLRGHDRARYVHGLNRSKKVKHYRY